MEQQQNIGNLVNQARKRATKREQFLTLMDRIVPWEQWIALIRPFYPSSGRRGRQPIELERMLRMMLLQDWFNLSDEGLEDAIYDSIAMQDFMRINFLDEQVPDATTLLHFRHLLEKHNLMKGMFDELQRILEKAGLIMHGGTILDATIINAPSSTKNQEKKRDPEMHQTKKGNEWRFGMKAHTGVDAGTGLVHSVECTAANVHDIVPAVKNIREDDEVVYGDSGYLGLQNRDEIKADKHLSSIDYRVNRRPSSCQKVSSNSFDWDRYIEHRKSSVRCKVEHPYRIIKIIFGFRKTVYRGIYKNGCRLFMLFASANLYMLAGAKRTLAPVQG